MSYNVKTNDLGQITRESMIEYAKICIEAGYNFGTIEGKKISFKKIIDDLEKDIRKAPELSYMEYLKRYKYICPYPFYVA